MWSHSKVSIVAVALTVERPPDSGFPLGVSRVAVFWTLVCYTTFWADDTGGTRHGRQGCIHIVSESDMLDLNDVSLIWGPLTSISAPVLSPPDLRWTETVRALGRLGPST